MVSLSGGGNRRHAGKRDARPGPQFATWRGSRCPWTIVRPVCERRAGVLGPGEQSIDICPTGNRVVNAELAALRRTGRNVGVLRELAPRVQHQHQPASELEHRRRSRRREIVAGVLCADQLPRFEAETVAVELEERSRSLTASVIRLIYGSISCLSAGAR